VSIDLTSLPNGFPLTPTVAADAFLIPRAVRGSAPRASLDVLTVSSHARPLNLHQRPTALSELTAMLQLARSLPNIDSCQTCFNMSAPGRFPADCCALCAAAGTASCYSASFYLGTCYFKPRGLLLS